MASIMEMQFIFSNIRRELRRLELETLTALSKYRAASKNFSF